MTPQQMIDEDRELQAMRDVVLPKVDDTDAKVVLTDAVKKKYLKQKISLRVVNHALDRIKLQARKEGIPYQTLINLILVQHTDNPRSRIYA